MEIFEADKSRVGEVDKFYREQGYHGSWSDDERAFVCTDDGVVVGSVKIEFNQAVGVLRGMYIDKNYQNQGIGTRLAEFIEPVLNDITVFCVPLIEAANFYKRIGFVETSEIICPTFLVERCKKYRADEYEITIMSRAPTLNGQRLISTSEFN
ncbi:GNAT family N-acetyltransferase [Vibrio profundum]|uniref:GNAT family N-acetyltransferase n=1 Tax=Vibrio profundum TaxID=2910247 RepID=UPI003D09E3AF